MAWAGFSLLVGYGKERGVLSKINLLNKIEPRRPKKKLVTKNDPHIEEES